MIRLRTRPPIPELLKSTKVEETKKQIEDKVKNGIPLNEEDFKPHWRNIKKYIWQWQDGKCCYCERKRDPNGEPDVEHYRPKGGINEENGHPGYWWLAYEWKNLFLACKSCNGSKKSTKFPLLPGGKRAFTGADDLDLEKPVLINPADEDPEKYIGFDCIEEGLGIMVKAVGLDKEGRGSETIEKLTYINGNEVMEQRGNLSSHLEATAEIVKEAEKNNDQHKKNKYCIKIKEHTSAKNEFAGFCRAYYREKGLGEYVSKD